MEGDMEGDQQGMGEAGSRMEDVEGKGSQPL